MTTTEQRNTMLDNALDNAARKRAVLKIQNGFRAAVKAFDDAFHRETGQHSEALPRGYRPGVSSLERYDYYAREQADKGEKAILELYDRATQDEFDTILKQVDALIGVLQQGFESQG